MKVVSIIETAEELIRIAKSGEADGPNQWCPSHITLVIDGDVPMIQDAEGHFSLSADVHLDDLIVAMAKGCNLVAVHVT